MVEPQKVGKNGWDVFIVSVCFQRKKKFFFPQKKTNLLHSVLKKAVIIITYLFNPKLYDDIFKTVKLGKSFQNEKFF